MKKQLLLLGATILIAGLTSCKKDLGKPVASTETGSKLKVNTLPQPTYIDLALMPRKPGENYDTYHATYHGSSVYVVGAPVYDISKYPTLVNGIPAYAQSMYADNGASIDFQNTGTDGNVFQVTQTLFSYTDYSTINTDEGNYFTAFNNWVKTDQSAPPPSIFTYVKSEYKSSSGGGVSIFTGKVICVTTGTHFGLAEINYPLPAKAPYTIPSTSLNIPDPNNSSIHYFLQGDKGLITSGNIEYFNGTTYTNGPAVPVSGSYTQVTPGSGNFHSIGTIIRSDNSTLVFDQTDNTN